MVGQPAACRSQAHATTLRFDQLRTGVASQGGDLLGHRRGGQMVLLGDGPHRTEPGQGQQQFQSPCVHIWIVSGGPTQGR